MDCAFSVLPRTGTVERSEQVEMRGEGSPWGPQQHRRGIEWGIQGPHLVLRDRSSPSGGVLSSAGEQGERSLTEGLGLSMGGPVWALLGCSHGDHAGEQSQETAVTRAVLQGPVRAVPSTWNVLSSALHSANSFSSFRSQLKSHFLQEACLTAHYPSSSDSGLHRILYFSLLVLTM